MAERLKGGGGLVDGFDSKVSDSISWQNRIQVVHCLKLIRPYTRATSTDARVATDQCDAGTVAVETYTSDFIT
jgi:hypothetical protein